MATDQESNNLDEFDLEQVINWEEHNYASKNLEIQQLPDLDLPTDLAVSGPSPLPGTSTTVSHGRQLLLGNQVIGSHPQQTREQNASIMAGMPQVPSTSSVLHPVFPQSASCMITDIRNELAHSTVPQSSRHVEPAFPSENFDLPSINHQSPLVSSGSQSLSYMGGHRSQVGSMQVPSAQPLGHAMPRHRSIHNGMSSFSQPNLTSSMPSLPVNEPLNQSMENDDGGDSIDQLIEDIVDRDMPQGVDDAVVFSSTSHGVSLSNQHQHQPMHHVMTQNPRSSSPSQMAAMVRSPSSGANGSPLAGGGSQLPSGKALGTSMPHASSPLSQNPASPIKVPSPQMPQYKASLPLRAARGGSKSIKIPTQQQPHSPQSMAIGVNQGQVHSPRQTPQRSPQQPGNAQSPPSAANSIMSQNISSPLAQMSPLASGASQNIMGNIGVQPSPVASPLNISSPQSQRPSRQASPGLCNIGSPVHPVAAQEFPKHQVGPSLSQSYMTQTNTSKASLPKQNSLQNGNNIQQADITQQNVVRTQGNVLHQQVSSMSAQDTCTNRGNIWTQNPFLSSQQLPRSVNNTVSPAQANVLSQKLSEQLPQEQVDSDIPSSSAVSQQGSTQVPTDSVSQTHPTSTFDTATVLRGLNALKGNNVLPVALKQGANNQQLQAVKLPNTAKNIDLLKQAMLLKAGQGGVGQTPGKPMSINTSQGQVFYYILPKGTNIGSGSGSASQSTSGQQVKMVLINTKSSMANTSVKTVNSAGGGTAKPSAQVFSLNNNSLPNSTATNADVLSPVISSFSSSSNPSAQGHHPMPGLSLAAHSLGESTAITSNHPSVITTSSQQQHSTLDGNLVNQLVSGQGDSGITIPSNPLLTQNVNTTQITFVNECTSVNHLVSATGVGQMASNIFTTHPVTLPVTTTVFKATAISSTSQPSAATGESDDSDTPLAVVAETLRKTGGDEKKKKKKKKGEKRKKKDRPSGSDKLSPAFQIFFKDTQAAIRQQNPSAQFNDVAKIVQQMWENLPEDQKKVYCAKYEKAKAEKNERKSQEPSPKIRKLENTSSNTASPISSPKTTGHPSSSSVTITTVSKEPNKQESITLKIPKSVLNKSEPPVKVAKVASMTVSKTSTAGSISSPPVKTKKPKMTINPISQRICIREGCNMPARTTKERGTQYCSNDCIIAHCRHVFNSWVSQRKQEVPAS